MKSIYQDFKGAKLLKDQIKNLIVVLKIYQIYVDEQIDNEKTYYSEVDAYICRKLIDKFEETITRVYDEGLYYHVLLSEDEADAIDNATSIAYQATKIPEFETKTRELIVKSNFE